MHNSELVHGTLSRRLQFQDWETGFETLDYNLHVRRNDLLNRTEQNSVINIETLTTSKLRPTVDRTGHRTENSHLLNSCTINVSSKQSDGTAHSWFRGIIEL